MKRWYCIEIFDTEYTPLYIGGHTDYYFTHRLLCVERQYNSHNMACAMADRMARKFPNFRSWTVKPL